MAFRKAWDHFGQVNSRNDFQAGLPLTFLSLEMASSSEAGLNPVCQLLQLTTQTFSAPILSGWYPITSMSL